MQSARRLASFRLSYAGGRRRGSAGCPPAWQVPRQLAQTISVSEQEAVGVTQVHFGSLGSTVSNRKKKKKKAGK